MLVEVSTEPDRQSDSRLVRVEPYDEAWPLVYETEAAELRKAIGPLIVEIEHVGSTAVPGLDAKPILDVLVAVRSWDGFDTLIDRLARLEYVYTPFDDTDDPRVFRKGPKDTNRLRTHHLHVTSVHSSYRTRLLAFRDHLRANDDDAAAYASLKCELAQRYASRPDLYTDAKTEFVRDIEAKAGLPRSSHRWH